MIKKYFRVTAKSGGMDVVLHAEHNFDVIFARSVLEIGHLKIMFFIHSPQELTSPCSGIATPQPRIMRRSRHVSVGKKNFPKSAKVWFSPGRWGRARVCEVRLLRRVS